MHTHIYTHTHKFPKKRENERHKQNVTEGYAILCCNCNDAPCNISLEDTHYHTLSIELKLKWTSNREKDSHRETERRIKRKGRKCSKLFKSHYLSDVFNTIIISLFFTYASIFQYSLLTSLSFACPFFFFFVLLPLWI